MSTTRTRNLKGASGAVAGALVLSLTFGVAGGALADDPDEQKKSVDKQLVKSKNDLDGISQELSAAVATMNSTSKKVGLARKDLDRAQRALNTANRENRDISGRLKVAQANEKKSLKVLAANKQAQQKSKVAVGGLARRSYMKGGLGGFEQTLNVLSSPGGGASDGLTLADVLARQQGGVLNSLSGQQATARSENARLGGIRRQISSLKIKAQAAVKRAGKARTDAQSAKSALDGLLKKQTRAAADLGKRKKAEQADIKKLTARSKQLGTLLRKRAAARAKARAAAAAQKKQAAVPDQVKAPPADGHFLTGPAPKAQISSPYGYRMHPILRVRRLHGGADFSFNCGTPVYAAAAGQVVQSGFNGVSGNHVIVDHGEVGGTSLATQYDHLSAITVRSGSVKKGQLIGRVGTTGRSTGCHLHFVVLANGNYVDPVNWIG
ncbi:M23 family metallopeptidase [Demetria terragena]|uniref:M23 family metallopeptidase n=1 Tax=Demetria terragena TaxID=63959 RepID=UPI00039DAEE6|nr:M23 family metallopeptidase [Demetria terragena]